MGGEGSGRSRESGTVAELLMDDDAFKNNVVVKTVQDYNSVVGVLMSIINGDEEEQIWDSKNCKFETRKPSLDSRIKAAKVWKEMTLDKVVSDKKTLDTQGQGNLLTLLDDLAVVAKAVEEEKAKKAKAVGGLQDTVKSPSGEVTGRPLEQEQQRHS